MTSPESATTTTAALLLAFVGSALLAARTTLAWQPSPPPNLFVKYDHGQTAFFGNASDHFKVLDQDDASLLVGARNALYNVSLAGLAENRRQRIEWRSSDAHRELCALKGKADTDCQNYIRVYARTSEAQVMICGTNSYKPYCRYYAAASGGGGFEFERELEAQGRCPYSPGHNSTYVYADGHLYSATVADFSGADPLIYRETQRTEQYDLKQLNQPAFVSAVEHNGYVFFFFRETAMEYMNCGKAIYSRVGRVCKNDKGGPYPYGDRWTSFLKSRLNCSMPGEYPFYFDEIQATTQIINGLYNGDRNSIIYIVMTTPLNAIGGSAVCAYSIGDILDVFEGRFKAQKDSNSNWLPVPAERVPDQRPGKCVEDSRTLPSVTVNFVRSHPLMEAAVPALHGRPLFVKVSLQYRLTAIAVDAQVEALDGGRYDVVYVGTDDGRVLKFVDTAAPDSSEANSTATISEMQALPHGTKVDDLRVAPRADSLIAIGSGQIVSTPLWHCGRATRCRECLNLQDPHCAWDATNHECVALRRLKASARETLVQDLRGKRGAELCKKFGETDNWIEPPPQIVVPNTRGVVSGVGRVPSNPNYLGNEITVASIDSSELTNSIPRYHNVEDPLDNDEPQSNQLNASFQLTPWWLLVVALAAALGVLLGIFLSRRFPKNEPFPCEHRNQLSWHGRSGKDINLLMNAANSYPPVPPLPANNKKDNLELELDSKDRNHECKNSTESLEKELPPYKTGTLQKVKKTYI